MEAVPENGSAESILSTPSSQPSSQKSQARNGVNGHKNGVNGVHDKTLASTQNSTPPPLSPTPVSHLAVEKQAPKNPLETLLDKLNDSVTEIGSLKERLAQKEANEALLGSQLELHRDEVRHLRLIADQEHNEKVAEILARERVQGELQQLKSSLAGLQARVEDAETQARSAERMQREADRKLNDAEIALNEANQQKTMLKSDLDQLHADMEKEVVSRAALQKELITVKETAEFELKLALDKVQRQTVPLDAVDSSSARRSCQDVDMNRLREQAQADMDAVRKVIEDQLTEMYQRKLDDMSNQLRLMDHDRLCEQQNAATADKSHREIAQQLADVQKVNREREDELNRLRDEYDKYKAETSETARNDSARYHKLVTTIAGGIKEYVTSKKEEEARLGISTPEPPADPLPRGKKRKQSEVGFSRAKARRADSVARFHSQATHKAFSKSRGSEEVGNEEVDPGKVMGTEDAGDKTTGIAGDVLNQTAPGDANIASASTDNAAEAVQQENTGEKSRKAPIKPKTVAQRIQPPRTRNPSARATTERE